MFDDPVPSFHFRKRFGEIDWRKLSSIDVDRVARELDFVTLQVSTKRFLAKNQGKYGLLLLTLVQHNSTYCFLTEMQQIFANITPVMSLLECRYKCMVE